MMRWLRSKSLMLAVGAALSSGFNFYSFVFLPSLVGTANLEDFVRANYLGGLYLFGIGSSIAPFSVYVFMSGKGNALFRYAMISLLGFTFVCAGGIILVNTSMSFACLGAALCMQLAGFFLASVIRQERILAASSLQMLQPMLFAGLLTMHEFGGFSELNWPYYYWLSCFSFVIFAAFVVDWKWLIEVLTKSTPVVMGWRSILGRIAISASFPLFFQLELILVGNFSSINLGDYAVVQKLYASISISLFGSVGLKMAMSRSEFFNDSALFVNKRVIYPALLVLSVVLLVGFGLSFFGKEHAPSVGLILGGAIVSAIYTVASFISLLATTFRPYLAAKAFIFSLSIYAIAFYLIMPQNSMVILMLSGVLFLAYIFFCQWSVIKR